MILSSLAKQCRKPCLSCIAAITAWSGLPNVAASEEEKLMEKSPRPRPILTLMFLALVLTVSYASAARALEEDSLAERLEEAKAKIPRLKSALNEGDDASSHHGMAAGGMAMQGTAGGGAMGSMASEGTGESAADGGATEKQADGIQTGSAPPGQKMGMGMQHGKGMQQGMGMGGGKEMGMMGGMKKAGSMGAGDTATGTTATGTKDSETMQTQQNQDARSMKGMETMGKGMMGKGMMGKGMMGKMPGADSARSALPGFPGLPHLYHIGAADFFLDHNELIDLTSEQKTAIGKIKEKLLAGNSIRDKKIDQAEQELWALTSSDRPAAGDIEAKIREIEKLRGDQRVYFIRAVGEAAALLTKGQRRSLLAPFQQASPPAPSVQER